MQQICKFEMFQAPWLLESNETEIQNGSKSTFAFRKIDQFTFSVLFQYFYVKHVRSAVIFLLLYLEPDLGEVLFTRKWTTGSRHSGGGGGFAGEMRVPSRLGIKRFRILPSGSRAGLQFSRYFSVSSLTSRASNFGSLCDMISRKYRGKMAKQANEKQKRTLSKFISLRLTLICVCLHIRKGPERLHEASGGSDLCRCTQRQEKRRVCMPVCS